MAKSITRQVLADNVAEAIMRQASEARLHKGQELPPVTRLADQFHVSRAVVREALEKLARRGDIKRSQSRRWVIAAVRRRRNGNGAAPADGESSQTIPHLSLADQAVAAVMDLIQKAGLKEGDTLPPSGELAKRFGVSVIVMREALASLAARGILYRRQGRESVVALPSHELISSILQFRSYLEGIGVDEFQTARASLEVLASSLAASNADDLGKKDELERCLKGMHEAASEDDFNESDLAFHLAVAHYSGNTAIELLLASLNHMVRRSLDVSYRRVRSRAGTKGIAVAVANHQRIAKAIIDGNPKAAANAMNEHFAYVVESEGPPRH